MFYFVEHFPEKLKYSLRALKHFYELSTKYIKGSVFPNFLMGLGLGRGFGRRGVGPPKYCICPRCGNVVPHEPGIPCRQLRCSKCGSFMVGERCRLTRSYI